jgi:ATP-dependent Lon protease
MTGDVTLHGEVISVSGIARKLEAAIRRSRKRVIIAAGNDKNRNKVADEVNAILEIVLVKTIQEALEKVLTHKTSITPRVVSELDILLIARTTQKIGKARFPIFSCRNTQ